MTGGSQKGSQRETKVVSGDKSSGVGNQELVR